MQKKPKFGAANSISQPAQNLICSSTEITVTILNT